MPAVLARLRLQTLQTILLVAPVLLFSVIAHEIAHGFAALRQGDRTALEAGRLSYQAGRIAKKRYATASSPFEGVISYIPGE